MEPGVDVELQVRPDAAISELFPGAGTVEAAVRFDDDLVLQAMNVKFDRAVELGGIEPFPYLRGGFSGMEMTEDGAAAVTDFHLGFQSQRGGEPFLTIKRVGASLAQLSLDPREIRLDTVVVDTPSLNISFDEVGAGHIPDLVHAIRAPTDRMPADPTPPGPPLFPSAPPAIADHA